MKSFMSAALAAVLLSLGNAAMAAGDGLAALGQFLAQTQSGAANFVQTVAAPKSSVSAQAQGRFQVSTGRFAFARPNKFRFDYQSPYAQTIVADGQTLWFYDPDLAQVTASAQAQALQNTPAALITNARSLADLQKQFSLQAIGAKQAPPVAGAVDLLWVEAKPKAAGGTVISLRVGLAQSAAGVQLKVLEVQDSLGQRSIMEFSSMSAHAPAADFRFSPPAGVAVLRQ